MRVREGTCPKCGAGVTIEFGFPLAEVGYSNRFLHNDPSCDRFTTQDIDFLVSILESSSTGSSSLLGTAR